MPLGPDLEDLMHSFAAHRRAVAARLVVALMTVVASLGLLLPMSAVRAAAADCVPEPGEVATFLTPDGELPPTTVPVGVDLDLVLVITDTCGTVRTDYTGMLDVFTYQAGGHYVEAPLLELTPADGGLADVRISVPRAAVTYLNVVDENDEVIHSSRLLVHEPDRRPLVDLALATFYGSQFSVFGHAVDPDHDRPVEMSIVVDRTVVARFPAAMEYPFSTGTLLGDADSHGFAWDAQIPDGRHVVCLYVQDIDPRGAATQVPVSCTQVDLNSAPEPPVGAFDGVHRTPAGYHAVGWAIDPVHPEGTATISVGSGPDWAPSYYPLPTTAGQFRADIGAAFPEWGAQHGFMSTGEYPEAGVRERFCAGFDGDTTGPTDPTSLGCVTIVPRYQPLGTLDAATGTAGGAVVRGWALDEDTYDPIDVHVYVDGRPAAVLRAGELRHDVAAAFPPAAGGLIPGYGARHGYEATVAMPAGRHRVCVYGIDVRAKVAAPNTLLGCRDVEAGPPRDPIGHLDGTSPRPGGVAVTGWAADPDAPASALQVHTYVDGRPVGATTADARRADLAVLGGSYGTAHGYTTHVATAARSRVCSYAINVGAGTQNTTLGCREVVRPVDPIGALDAVARSGSQVQVRGWALDPDTDAALPVHVYVDGRFAGALTANGSRPDVAAGFPGWSTARGYTAAVTAAPGARVCAYAINTALGSTNTTLGCRTA